MIDGRKAGVVQTPLLNQGLEVILPAKCNLQRWGRLRLNLMINYSSNAWGKYGFLTMFTIGIYLACLSHSVVLVEYLIYALAYFKH